MAEEDWARDEPGEAAGGGAGGGGDGPGAVPAAPAPPEPQREVLSLAQLIGAPIHALVDAEAQSALATARFIRNVGFNPPAGGDPGDLGALQMARFTAVRRGPDGREEPVQVEIPMLTLLPIPALQIRDATLDYTVKVIQTEALVASRREMERHLSDGGRLPLEAPATMRATLASDSRRGNRRSADMLVKMKVRIEQADMPAGLSRLLNLASESVARTALPPDVDDGEDDGSTPEPHATREPDDGR